MLDTHWHKRSFTRSSTPLQCPQKMGLFVSVEKMGQASSQILVGCRGSLIQACPIFLLRVPELFQRPGSFRVLRIYKTRLPGDRL
jgi:hypothetical protein